MNNVNINNIYKIFACPNCLKPIERVQNEIICLSCGSKYEIRGDIPILLKEEEKKEIFNEYATEAGKETIARYGFSNKYVKKIKEFIANQGMHYGLNMDDMLKTMVTWNGRDTVALDIGSGAKRIHEKFINLNIDIFPYVDIVGSVYRLPFLDNSVDSIFCSAVLEHLLEPQKAMKEIIRVLKPGGYVLIGVPFLVAYHAYPIDQQRWTLDGLSYLCKDFQEVRKGIASGPS